MAMTAGTATMAVTVAPGGQSLQATYGGTGMAAAFIAVRGARLLTTLNAQIAAQVAAIAPALATATGAAATQLQMQLNNIVPQALTGAQMASGYLVSNAEDDANAIVPYIQANATANISTSLGGLQTSTNSGSATNPPATTKTIPIQ
jgi:hypothetical protein